MTFRGKSDTVPMMSDTVPTHRKSVRYDFGITVRYQSEQVSDLDWNGVRYESEWVSDHRRNTQTFRSHSPLRV
ncbi:hypothetical protein SBV1_220002 [Verrucomicrobia bacterium]|nr:hypothetical protein SBV1_220002 [Verrucomicrobiota bacterium]